MRSGSDRHTCRVRQDNFARCNYRSTMIGENRINTDARNNRINPLLSFSDNWNISGRSGGGASVAIGCFFFVLCLHNSVPPPPPRSLKVPSSPSRALYVFLSIFYSFISVSLSGETGSLLLINSSRVKRTTLLHPSFAACASSTRKGAQSGFRTVLCENDPETNFVLCQLLFLHLPNSLL